MNPGATLRRRLSRATLPLAAATLLGSVAAHADLDAIDPVGGAQLAASPERIALSFTEPVEVRFSRFELLPLGAAATDLTVDAGAADPDADHDHADPDADHDHADPDHDHADVDHDHADVDHDHADVDHDAATAAAGAAIPSDELLRLNGLAGARVRSALEQRAAADALPLQVVAGSDRSSEVALELPAPLPVGDYVVLWRVLSIDSHTSQGYSVFRVTGSEEAP